ncbi:MAG: DinB family protein [Phycisphaerales bacterium]
MGYAAGVIVPAAQRGLQLADALLGGIAPELFARQPEIDGRRVGTNHPAFIYGHLSLYPARILSMAGADPAAAAVPEAYEALFAAGVECRDDPEGSVYPPMDEIVANFRSAHEAGIAFVEGLDDKALAGPHQGPERYRQVFPTLGIATNFMLTSHVMMHLGQCSAWRRCMGLGSAM